MPLFFLHVRDRGTLIRDEEGFCFDDLSAAQKEAVESARELLAESIRTSARLGLERSIEICDASGVTVLEVPFREAVTG